jgi:hypothetical protein
MALTKYATTSLQTLASSSDGSSAGGGGQQFGRVPSNRLFWVALLVGFGGSFHFGFQLTVTNPSHGTFLHFVNHSFLAHYGGNLEDSRLEVCASQLLKIIKN